MAQFKILSDRWIIDDVLLSIFRDTAVQGDPKVLANTDTVNALYSALQDRFDEPDMMDQLVPMSAQTPTEYTMINGWFIGNESTEFLKGGAIQTIGWAGGVIRVIGYDDTVAFGAADIGRTITGTTTGDTATILDFDDRTVIDDQGWLYIRPDVPATDLFDNGSEAYTVGGSSAAGSFTTDVDAGGSITGESLWANPFTLGAIVDNSDLYFFVAGERVVSKTYNVTVPLQWWTTGQVDVLLNVRELGQQVDRGFVMVLARQGGTGHDFFRSDLSAGGRQPLPLSAGTDANDQGGHREMVTSGTSSGNWAVGDRIEDDTDTTIRGVITAVAGTNPNIELQYYLIGDPQNDFTGATGAFSNLDDTGAATAVAPTNVNGGLAGGITVTIGLTTEDIANGNGAVAYSVRINPNSVVLGTVFERLKFLLRRGATTDLDATNLTGVEGQEYVGVELRVDFSAQTGTFVQGEKVFDTTTKAEGFVVAIDNTADYAMIAQVAGVFTAANQIGDAASGPTDFATIDTAEVVTPIKPCALGTLAGGVFFSARGVCLTSANVNSADVQNYQLLDNAGVTQIPPNVVSIAIDALVARNEGSHTGGTSTTVLIDSAAAFQTDETAGEIKVGDLVFNITDGSRGTIVSIDTENQITTSLLTGGISDDWTTGGLDLYAITQGDVAMIARVDGGGLIQRALVTSGVGNVAGDGDFICNGTIPSDTPAAGVLRVVDVTDASERRYRYSSFATTTFTLVIVTDSGGQPTANDATNGAVAMDDTTADFTGAAVPAKRGDEIRNITDGGIATITQVYEQRLEHTPLAGGTNNDWQTTDTYEINELTQAYDNGADTAYAMILDEINETEDVTQLSNSLTFSSGFNVTIRIRQGKVILPIIGSGAVGSTGLTFPAGRILDTIAA